MCKDREPKDTLGELRKQLQKAALLGFNKMRAIILYERMFAQVYVCMRVCSLDDV